MDAHRSLSLKPSRLLFFFSLTVSSSLLLCSVFYFLVLSGSSSGTRETHVLLRSFFETTVGESFVRFSGVEADGGGDLGGTGGRGNSSGLARKVFPGSIQERLCRNSSSETHFSEAAVSSKEGKDSSGPKRKDFFLEETQEAEDPDSPEEGADFAEESDDASGSDAADARFGESDPVLEGEASRPDAVGVKEEPFLSTPDASGKKSPNSSAGRIEEKGVVGACDISKGRWVFDESYPLYTNETCPFVDEGFSCQSNGRPDRDYMKWRWHPYGCNFPRFNAVKMLEMIRGKRLVFVGDSVNRNQWESLLCMLRGGVSDPRRVYEARGRRITKEKGFYNFKFSDYHCSVEYYVTHYLVHESKARIGKKRVQTLRIDSIDRTSSKWKGADILIFNTAHWWSHHKTKAGKNYFQEGDQVHPLLDASIAFQKALTTWGSWVDRHVTPGKTQVFFRSSSPSHFSGGEWNSGGHCMEKTQPLNETFTRSKPRMNTIVEQVINQMRTPVKILDVTAMSGLRIDGHPSIYGRNPSSGRRSSGVQDCSHWCLPGVPDAWNELLYFHLLSQQKPHSAN